ncbi:MAG: protein kinase [Kofleriaceae bacterium]
MAGSGKPGTGTDETISASGLAGGMPSHTEIGPGSMVGEYQIEGMLGEGGMGRVYSATHPVIAKRAAVKVLHPELSMHREAVERFIQEARSVNQIGHPNIVDIFAFGTLSDGRCYFVMEWLRGESLRSRLERGPMTLAQSLVALETVLIALEAAHEKGIVHRDLKPDNIFLVEIKGTQPQVKLLDFGIAKLLGNDNARAERTRTGNLLGTPAYISPEQARGHLVDHRTDVYAAGALAYEMFTGELPFPADNAADMLAKHLFAPPPSARDKNPHVPPPLDMVVMRMLAKDAAHRPTLAEARDEFRRALQFVTANGIGEPSTVASHAQVTIPGAYTPVGAVPTPAGYHQPSHHSQPPGYATPPAGTQSVAAAPPAKSRTLFAVIGGLIAIAIGVAVFFGNRGSASGPPAQPATSQPAAAPAEPAKPAIAAPEPATPAQPDQPEPAKTEPAKLEPAKPEPAKPEPAKPEPAADPATPEPAKTAPAKPAKPAKPARPKPRKPAKPAPIDDPDAAM